MDRLKFYGDSDLMGSSGDGIVLVVNSYRAGGLAGVLMTLACYVLLLERGPFI